MKVWRCLQSKIESMMLGRTNPLPHLFQLSLSLSLAHICSHFPQIPVTSKCHQNVEKLQRNAWSHDIAGRPNSSKNILYHKNYFLKLVPYDKKKNPKILLLLFLFLLFSKLDHSRLKFDTYKKSKTNSYALWKNVSTKITSL